MRKPTTLALIALLFVSGTAFAQSGLEDPWILGQSYTPVENLDTFYVGESGQWEAGIRCGAPQPTALERARAEAEMRLFEALFPEEPQLKKTRIPVVFHVVYRGNGRGNVPDEQIEAQMDELNKAFRRHGFIFELQDVNRKRKNKWHRRCGDFGRNYDRMTKRLSVDPANTLNIYLCSPEDGVLGFAFFPWSFPEDSYYHGVTALYSSLPGGDAAPYDEGATIIHEVGHYLGLYHTFQDGCFGSGDEVNDTPPEASPAFGCPIGRDTCVGGGADPVTNFMDYSDDFCLEEFTKQQRKRMRKMVRLYRPSLR